MTDGKPGTWMREQLTVQNCMVLAVLIFQIGGVMTRSATVAEKIETIETRLGRLESARTDERTRLDTIYMSRDLAKAQYDEILRRLERIETAQVQTVQAVVTGPRR